MERRFISTASPAATCLRNRPSARCASTPIPFSPEYDRPGFGRIQIFTKPGSDKIRGQAFMQYNKEALNSRSPLLDQSKRPPYQQQFYGLSLSGPLLKSKASFGFDAEHRTIDENAFILATTLDASLNPLTSTRRS
jgi:hypothetical protein